MVTPVTLGEDMASRMELLQVLAPMEEGGTSLAAQEYGHISHIMQPT